MDDKKEKQDSLQNMDIWKGYEKYKTIIDSKCKLADSYNKQAEKYPIYVADIKCSKHSITYKKLTEYLSVAKCANKWKNWIAKSYKMTSDAAQQVICKAKKDIDAKYLLWWRKHCSKRDHAIYFSEQMMKKDGIIIKTIENEYTHTPIGTSCDISSLVVKGKRRNKVVLFPGKITLNVNSVNTLPPFPTDANFESTPSANLIDNQWIIRLLKTKQGHWQLLICYIPAVQIKRELRTKMRMCGIDLGVCHFATIYDPSRGTLFVDACMQDIFDRKRHPTKYELQSFGKEMLTFHTSLTTFLVRNYSLIVVGNLSVQEDDYSKNYNLALKMEHLNYSRFRNLLIQYAFPREETGCTVIVVDEYRTSRTCSSCSFYSGKCPFDGSFFSCPKCKIKVNRDLNAAKNILNSVLKSKKSSLILQCS